MIKENIEYTTEDSVYCDGYDSSVEDDTHPRVFYTFKNNTVECMYCNKIFIKKENE